MKPGLADRSAFATTMIDYLALALTHGLLLIALVRLLQRDALDNEDVATLAQTDAKRQAGMAESTDPRRRAGRTSRPDSAKRPHPRRMRYRN